MSTFSNQNLLLPAPKFYCNFCDYGTSKKSSYNDHLLTAKHKKSTFSNQNQPKFCQNLPSNFKCENCYKEYKDKSGLWRHKKKCKNEEFIELDKNNEPTDKELIVMLLKQNSQLIDKNCELSKNCQMNNSNNTTTNSHNKAFNLNFFLNETCKDAMNITDFVDSIKLQLDDLIKVGEIGYVEGISNIITKNLNALDVTQRPIHCTDKKREVLYVKDEDKWEKEDNEKMKMRKVIKKVASKNQRLIPEYKKEHPDYCKYSSKTSDQYNKIIVEAMGGSGDNDFEKEDKIIKNISKVTTID